MSVNIRIKLLDGRELDYTSPESLNIKMNRIADDLNNPDNRFSEYSYTFSLPKTKNNVEIFEYAGVNAIKNSFKTNPIECRLYNDEKLILDGQIELRSVDDSYNCVFYSKFVQLVDSIKGKNLRDIQSLPHISGFTYEDYIRDHINADYGNCDETPYQFPFVFYNTIYTPTGVYTGVTDQNGDQFRKDTNRQNYYNLLNRTSNSMPNEFYFHQFPLSWYLKPVLEAMLKDAGWTLGGSFFENDNIKKIIMPYVGDSDVYDLATYCSKEPQVTYEIIYNWVQEVPNMSLKSAAITNVNRISPSIYFDDIVGTDIILDSLTGSISGSTTFIGQQYIGDYSSGDFNIDTRKYQIVATQTFTRKDYIVYQNGNFVSSGSTTFDQQVIVYPGISKFLDPIVANMLIADGDVIRIEITEYFTELDCTIDGTVDYGISIPSPTPTMTPTPSITPTMTPTPSITPSISVTPSVTPTASIIPSMTPTPTITPSSTPPGSNVFLTGSTNSTSSTWTPFPYNVKSGNVLHWEVTGAVSYSVDNNTPSFDFSTAGTKYFVASATDSPMTISEAPLANLELLTLNVDNLTSINNLSVNNSGNLSVLDFSNNTNLLYLNISNTSITNPDFTSLTLLRQLSLNSVISSIVDLSTNPDITLLSVSGCGMADLVVSGCTGMTSLYASNGILTTIDLSQNTVLEIIDLSNQDLTYVDFANCPSIRQIQIESNNLSVTVVNTILDELISFNNPSGGYFSCTNQVPAITPDSGKVSTLSGIWSSVNV